MATFENVTHVVCREPCPKQPEHANHEYDGGRCPICHSSGFVTVNVPLADLANLLFWKGGLSRALGRAK